jgi:hypothetical protein
LLGLVFLVAAATKVSAPQDFADAVAAYHLLPVAAVNLVALSLPWFELLCGLSLTLGIFPGTGLLGTLGLLGVFTGALLLAELRGLHPACGCFGAISWLEATPPLALTRDAILFVAGLAAYRAHLAARPLDKVRETS